MPYWIVEVRYIISRNCRPSNNMFWSFFFVLSAVGVTIGGTNLINNGREEIKLRNIFYSAHKKEVVAAGKLQDQCPDRGSFKIDDEAVIGGGTYEIADDGVEIDLKIKIKPGCGKPATSSVPPTGPIPAGSPNPAGSTKPPTGPIPAGSPNPAGSTKPPTVPSPASTSNLPTGPTLPPGTGGPQTTSAPAPGQGAATPATEGPTTPSSLIQGSDVEQESLTLHNKFRAIHGAPAMTLNADLSRSAAAYAAELARKGEFQHASKSERAGAGENLSYGCSSSKGQTVEEAVTNWYNEVCDPGYTFGSESMGGAGHFTQVVWKGSLELGFGKADGEKNGMKCTYYVGRYKPAGNMIGSFAENVLKGSFDTSYCRKIQTDSLF